MNWRARRQAGAALALLPILLVPTPAAADDLDAMVERGLVRALVPYSRTFYYVDGPEQRGLTYEWLRAFEAHLNETLGRTTRRVDLVIEPVRRDELIPALLEGRGDLAAGNLTITPERSALVDFSKPLLEDVAEVLVTGPAAPPVATIDDLAGARIPVRESSSYHASLVSLSGRFVAEGRPPIALEPIDEDLEDEDLLEMVGAGLLPMIVVDRHKALAWTPAIPDVTVREDIVLRDGGAIGWAVRQDSPKLRAAIDDFVATARQGTLLGNILYDRYLDVGERPASALDRIGEERFVETVGLFRHYGDAYGLDWLLLMALGYQESGLDQTRKSAAGAVGVMQIRPATARDPNVGVENVERLENNIEAGVTYLAFLRDRYFAEPAIGLVDQHLLTFAAYNAGPARVAGLREKAAAAGYDPNRWFGHVERMAARELGRETVHYVANIFKYYVAYRAAAVRLAEREQARLARMNGAR